MGDVVDLALLVARAFERCGIAYFLLLLAERSWRRFDGQELLPLVHLGVRFKGGVRVERDGAQVPVLMKTRLSMNRKARKKVAA